MRIIVVSFLFICFAFGSDTIQTAYYKSYDYEKMQNYEEAIKVLIPVYDAYPNGYTVNLRLGWLFYLDAKFADAKKHYTKAARTLPSSIEAKLGLINVALRTQNYKEVEFLANQILKIDYYNFYANLNLVRALIAEKKFKIATQTVLKMTALYPTNVAFLEQLFIIYTRTADKRADRLAWDILVLDPNNVTVAKIRQARNMSASKHP